MEAIVQKWLEERRVDFVNAIDRRGQKASGNTQQKTYVFITEKGGGIKTPQHVGALLYGRSPNKKQSKEDLKKWVGWAGSTFLDEWVKNKGLSISPYAVAYSIAKKGITVPNKYNDGQLYNEVFTTEKFNELYSAIGAKGVLTIKEQVKKSWQ